MTKQINIKYIETVNNEYAFPKGPTWENADLQPQIMEYYTIQFPDNAVVTIDFKQGEVVNRWIISKKEKK